MTHTLTPASFEDIAAVCADLDADGFSEAAALGVRDRLALAFLIHDTAADTVHLWSHSGERLGLIGATRSGVPGVGHPWALLTPQAKAHRKALLGRAKEALEFLSAAHGMDVLWNTKASDRVTELRWLERIGFDLQPNSVVNGNTTIFSWRKT